MNSNVYVVTLIFLGLENVAGCFPSSSRDTSIKKQHPVVEKRGDKNDLEWTYFSPYLYHQWYQSYKNGSSEIHIPPQTGVKLTRFIIEVEEFDNNTEIFCENSIIDTSNETHTHTFLGQAFNTFNIAIGQINSVLKFESEKLVNNEFYNKTLLTVMANENYKENKGPTILNYNEKQKVSFSCQEYEYNNETKYTQMGQINTNYNMIKTNEAHWMEKLFDITDNGTILCCVYYVVNGTAEEKWITRHVANKTLLFYDDTARQDALGGKENLGTSTDLKANSVNQIIIITTAVAVVFILLIIIVICRKRCRKKPESGAKVLYADLDFLRQIEPDSFPKTGPEEESPYAQIIGEMRPQTK